MTMWVETKPDSLLNSVIPEGQLHRLLGVPAAQWLVVVEESGPRVIRRGETVQIRESTRFIAVDPA